MSSRCTLIVVRMLRNKSIETLTIGRYYVFDIDDIFQPTFYLKRGGSSLDEFVEMLNLAHILQREQMALVLPFTSVGINQIELHAAELGTGTPVSRTLETILGSIAQPAIADTKCSVDEYLQIHIGHLTMDGCYLLNRQFTSEHYTTETDGA